MLGQERPQVVRLPRFHGSAKAREHGFLDVADRVSRLRYLRHRSWLPFPSKATGRESRQASTVGIGAVETLNSVGKPVIDAPQRRDRPAGMVLTGSEFGSRFNCGGRLRGRKVPELVEIEVSEYRELVHPPLRLMYRVAGSEVVLIGVLDSRRGLADLILERALGV